MTTRILGLLSVIAIAGCATTHTVYPADSEEAKHVRGVHYALPKAALTVDLPIKLTTYKPGKYAKYARALLNIDVGQSATKSFSITDPTLGTFTYQDTDHVYVVRIDGGPLEERELVMELTNLGFLTTATSTVTDKTIPIVVETLKTTAEIAGKVIRAAGASNRPPATEISYEALSWYLDELNENRYALVNVDIFWKAVSAIVVPNKISTMTEKSFDDLLGKSGMRLLTLDELAKLNRAIARIENVSTREACEKAINQSLSLVVYLKAVNNVADGKSYITKLLDEIYRPILPKGASVPATVKNVVLTNVILKVGDQAKSVVILEKPGAFSLFTQLELEDAGRLALAIRDLENDKESFLLSRGISLFHHGEGTATALTAIENRRAEMLKPFIGTKIEVTWTASYRITTPSAPSKAPTTWTLCEIGSRTGVKLLVTAGVDQVAKVPPGFVVDKIDPDDDPILVVASLVCDPSTQLVSKVQSNVPRRDGSGSTSPEGFYYRIPANGEFEIVAKQSPNPDRRLARSTASIPQYGKVVALPRSTGSVTKSSYVFELYPESGGLKKITVKGNPLPAGTVSGVGEAVNTLQDAEAARKAASEAERKAEETNERKQTEKIESLTAERDLLKLQQEIDKLKSGTPESGVGSP